MKQKISFQMNKMIYNSIKISIFWFIVLFTVSCRPKENVNRMVSVSILPQKYLVERIAGDYLQVNVMVPPGMNPTTCDLNTQQLKKLYDSDICFTIGYLPFETTHLYPVLKNRQDIRLVNHSKGLDLIAGSCGHSHSHEGPEAHKTRGAYEGGVDPHIWLSPRYVKIMADTILKVLSEQYPEAKEQFQTHYSELVADIERVAEEAGKTIGPKQHKTFLIYHPALTYLARDYGMEQISLEDEGKEPQPAHLKQIIGTIREKEIPVIFIQKQFDETNAQSIARETGITIVPIDPLNENWLEEMNRLIRIFETRLN